METNSSSRDTHELYIARRKKSVLLFFVTVYVFCALFLLVHFGIVKFAGTNKILIMLFAITIFIGNCITIAYMHHAKRFYMKVPIPKYNDISVYTLKEKILYPVPIVVTAYFSILPVLCLVAVLGTIYYNLELANKPPYLPSRKI